MSDTAAIAEQQHAFWNSPAARRWATEQARIDRVFAGFTEAALKAAAAKPGETVLDIGCGTGSTLLRLAETVGPSGHALGVDISAQQLDVARGRIAASGMTHVAVTLADASTHGFPPASIDLAFTRFGVMFFADPVAAFVNIRGAMKPGGRLAFAVFRTPAENPWAVAAVTALARLVPLPPPPGPEEPGQFGWADPARVRRILGSAGFQNITLTPFDVSVPLGKDATEATEVAATLGQTGRLLQELPDAPRAAARAALHAFFAARETPAGINLPGALWLVSATNG